MSYLALSNELVRQYWEYRYGSSFDKEKIRKLFKYIHPFLVSENQLPINPSDRPVIVKQIMDPLMKCIENISEEDLVKKTQLKLMLTDRNENKPFVTVNVMADEIKVNFTATYKANRSREKARKHIKALLEDASHIRIIDKYLVRDEKWNKCKQILKQILPQKNIRITILTTCGDRDSEKSIPGEKKGELERLYSEWQIKGGQFNDAQYHDRYIETDKVRIVLSSGIENLADDGKDLTYVVEIKK